MNFWDVCPAVPASWSAGCHKHVNLCPEGDGWPPPDERVSSTQLCLYVARMQVDGLVIGLILFNLVAAILPASGTFVPDEEVRKPGSCKGSCQSEWSKP